MIILAGFQKLILQATVAPPMISSGIEVFVGVMLNFVLIKSGVTKISTSDSVQP